MAYDEDLIKNPKGGMPRLIEIMRALRDPDAGCPWDIEQTFETIAPYTIEEAYEVADAIERENWSELRGELGDLLLQSVYHTQMAAEAGLFDFNDVANDISDKMVARHPHVLATKAAINPLINKPKIGKKSKPPNAPPKTWWCWMMSPWPTCPDAGGYCKNAPHVWALTGLIFRWSSIKSLKRRESLAKRKRKVILTIWPRNTGSVVCDRKSGPPSEYRP